MLVYVRHIFLPLAALASILHTSSTTKNNSFNEEEEEKKKKKKQMNQSKVARWYVLHEWLPATEA
jgi:hypothetical protein